jgi:hypothetical protein
MGKKSKGKKSKGSVNNRCKECRCKECKCKDEIHCYQIRGYSKGSKGCKGCKGCKGSKGCNGSKGCKGKGRKCDNNSFFNGYSNNDKKYTLAHVIGNMLGQTRRKQQQRKKVHMQQKHIQQTHRQRKHMKRTPMVWVSNWIDKQMNGLNPPKANKCKLTFNK